MVGMGGHLSVIQQSDAWCGRMAAQQPSEKRSSHDAWCLSRPCPPHMFLNPGGRIEARVGKSNGRERDSRLILCPVHAQVALLRVHAGGREIN
jgi:hypothetical protein